MRVAFLAVSAALALSACAEGGGGYGPYFAGDTVYYDDAYGPIYNGYWGDGDVFYYSSGRGHAYVRDDAHHFRRDQATGFHSMHTHGGWRGFHHP
jgi:hypothetical protein